VTSCVLYCHFFIGQTTVLLIYVRNYSYLVGSVLHNGLALYIFMFELPSQYGLFFNSLSSVKCTGVFKMNYYKATRDKPEECLFIEQITKNF
jgi:hypothetical protein